MHAGMSSLTHGPPSECALTSDCRGAAQQMRSRPARAAAPGMLGGGPLGAPAAGAGAHLGPPPPPHGAPGAPGYGGLMPPRVPSASSLGSLQGAGGHGGMQGGLQGGGHLGMPPPPPPPPPGGMW